MDWKVLEYFLRVTELGSINRAATDLRLSQPALSRCIATLEREMGAVLFTRTQAGVHLTDSGKLLADRARPLLRQYAIVKEQVGERAAGQLSVGIPSSWQHVFTSTFAARMVSQHPGVSLRIYEGVSNVLRDHMLAGLVDLSVIPFDETTPEGYEQTPLVREPLVLVRHAGSGLDPRVPLPLSRLDGVRLVLPGRANALRVQVEHALRRKGMKFSLAVETDTLALCLDLAREGVGCTVVPVCALYRHGLGDEIEWSPISGAYITWSLFENKARGHSQAVREGKSVLLTTLEQGLASKNWPGAEPASDASRAAKKVVPAKK